MSASDKGIELLNKLADIAERNGPFASGMFFATCFYMLFYWLTSRERKEYIRSMTDREKYLDEQLRVKEKRIDELHRRLNNKGSK